MSEGAVGIGDQKGAAVRVEGHADHTPRTGPSVPPVAVTGVSPKALSHVYATAGAYTISVTATDENTFRWALSHGSLQPAFQFPAFG
jgi:hypothetical protein